LQNLIRNKTESVSAPLHKFKQNSELVT